MRTPSRYSVVSARFSESEYKCLLQHAEENGFESLSDLVRHSLKSVIGSAAPSVTELITQIDIRVTALEAEMHQRSQLAKSMNSSKD
jgi:hypothetical protein